MFAPCHNNCTNGAAARQNRPFTNCRSAHIVPACLPNPCSRETPATLRVSQTLLTLFSSRPLLTKHKSQQIPQSNPLCISGRICSRTQPCTVHIFAFYTQMSFDVFKFGSTYWLRATCRPSTSSFEILHEPADQLCNVLRYPHSASAAKIIGDDWSLKRLKHSFLPRSSFMASTTNRNDLAKYRLRRGLCLENNHCRPCTYGCPSERKPALHHRRPAHAAARSATSNALNLSWDNPRQHIISFSPELHGGNGLASFRLSGFGAAFRTNCAYGLRRRTPSSLHALQLQQSSWR